MSSTVLDYTFACAVAALAGAANAAESPPPLSCETRLAERTALKQAPRGARRLGKHVLEVSSGKISQRFIDEPPYDDADEMRGKHWRYCGYDIRAKAHLIGMVDESVYSGDVLLEDSGRLVPAGHTVFFSPNKDVFLAITQEAGMDGERWALHDRNGQTLWSGYAGTTRKEADGDMVISTFERPQWTRQGVLTARFVCASSNSRGIVTLIQSAPGTWRWQGHGKCS